MTCQAFQKTESSFVLSVIQIVGRESNLGERLIPEYTRRREGEFGANRCSGYRPIRCLLALMAERASRSASRRRSVSRLSQSCLPLAMASSHLTRPFLK